MPICTRSTLITGGASGFGLGIANMLLEQGSTVADIVNAVTFLLSDNSAFITGSTIDVDGGLINTAPVRGFSK